MHGGISRAPLVAVAGGCCLATFLLCVSRPQWRGHLRSYIAADAEPHLAVADPSNSPRRAAVLGRVADQHLTTGDARATEVMTPSSAVEMEKGQHGLPPQKRFPVGRLHISVKTSTASEPNLVHVGRVAGILETWHRGPAGAETWFVTDVNHTALYAAAGGRLHATGCPSSHGRAALCCKTASEIGLFYARRQADPQLRWFCHIDDDMCVNVLLATTCVQ
jgi:hypothetical protein